MGFPKLRVQAPLVPVSFHLSVGIYCRHQPKEGNNWARVRRTCALNPKAWKVQTRLESFTSANFSSFDVQRVTPRRLPKGNQTDTAYFGVSPLRRAEV